jgi:hypothetical protein
MTVLVVTRDADLVARLETGPKEPSHLELRFAESAYDASSLVASFRPAFVVLDSDSVEDASGILDHLLKDDRVPGVRVILCANGSGRLPPLPERIIRTSGKPLDRAALVQAIRSIPIEREGVRQSCAMASLPVKD